MKEIKIDAPIGVDALHEELEQVKGLVEVKEDGSRRAYYNLRMTEDGESVLVVPDEVDEQVIKKLLKDHDPARTVARILSPKEEARVASRQRLSELIGLIDDQGIVNGNQALSLIAEALREIAARLDDGGDKP